MSRSEGDTPGRRRSRLVPRLCWAASGLSLLFALGWIAFSEDKSLGIFFGIVALVITRILVGDVARWHEEATVRDERDERIDPSPD